ncbi:MAG: 2-C-methyl-D-erythritol 4-phosphate cytidylyltransferase [Malacoplasma sp.]|nr:2-C-methyl-D-erythritol 4-phosphate cytidylyltransferase [Malacoplasma sp.]
MLDNKTKTYAILLAAGNSTRIKLHSIPKQFLTINNTPLFVYSLKQLLLSSHIDNVVLVINKIHYEYVLETVAKLKNHEKINIVFGDTTRSLSLKNALVFLRDKFLLKQNDIILTHDASRIWLTKDMIKQSISAFEEKQIEAITLAYNPDDAIGIGNSLTIEKTLKRNEVFIIQTPQCARFSVFKAIYFDNIIESGKVDNAPDLCYLVTLLNKKTKVILGDKHHFKITYDADLKMLSKLLTNN